MGLRRAKAFFRRQTKETCSAVSKRTEPAFGRRVLTLRVYSSDRRRLGRHFFGWDDGNLLG